LLFNCHTSQPNNKDGKHIDGHIDMIDDIFIIYFILYHLSQKVLFLTKWRRKPKGELANPGSHAKRPLTRKRLW